MPLILSSIERARIANRIERPLLPFAHGGRKERKKKKWRCASNAASSPLASTGKLNIPFYSFVRARIYRNSIYRVYVNDRYVLSSPRMKRESRARDVSSRIFPSPLPAPESRLSFQLSALSYRIFSPPPSPLASE